MSRSMCSLGLVASLFCAPLHAEEKASPRDEQLNRLIQKMGHEEWTDREEASEQIRGLSRNAIPRLKAALDTDDEEIRTRLEEAIKEIRRRHAFTSPGSVIGVNSSEGKVVLFSVDGEVAWKMENLANPHDADRLPSGNMLIVERDLHQVIEVNRNKEVVWQAKVEGDPVSAERLKDGTTRVVDIHGGLIDIDGKGKEVTRRIVLSRAQTDDGREVGEGTFKTPIEVDTLSGGRLLLSEYGKNRVVLIDGKKKVLQISEIGYPADADFLGKGKILVTDLQKREVALYDRAGKKIRSVGGFSRPFDADATANGDWYVADHDLGLMKIPAGKDKPQLITADPGYIEIEVIRSPSPKSSGTSPGPQ